MHSKRILNVKFNNLSNLSQKEEGFKRPRATNKMLRKEGNTWVPQVQFHTCCWIVKTVGAVSKKKRACIYGDKESNRSKTLEKD